MVDHTADSCDINSTVFFLIIFTVPGDEEGTDFKLIAIIVGTVVPGVILLALIIACFWNYSTKEKHKPKKKSYRYGRELLPMNWTIIYYVLFIDHQNVFKKHDKWSKNRSLITEINGCTCFG